MRYSKTVNGTKTYYVFDKQGRITAEVDSNKSITANYIWAPDRTLAKIDNSGTYYYIYNGHGDVVQILDTSGNIVNQYSYDLWDNFEEQIKTIHNPFTYFGQQFDDSTGLCYLRARYYDPKTGTFTQEDTHWNQNNMLHGDSSDNNIPSMSAIMQSSNLYNYGLHNPVTYIDPTGEITLITCIIIGAIIGTVAGTVTAAVISYNKYNEVKWQYAAIGFVSGMAIGASISSIVYAIGVTAFGTISTGLYKTLEQGVNFTKTTMERMTNSGRFVPVQTLIQAIKYGTASPDPQGTAATMYTIEMTRNGKAYTLEVLYDAVSNTIYHFLYK